MTSQIRLSTVALRHDPAAQLATSEHLFVDSLPLPDTQ